MLNNFIPTWFLSWPRGSGGSAKVWAEPLKSGSLFSTRFEVQENAHLSCFRVFEVKRKVRSSNKSISIVDLRKLSLFPWYVQVFVILIQALLKFKIGLKLWIGYWRKIMIFFQTCIIIKSLYAKVRNYIPYF